MSAPILLVFGKLRPERKRSLSGMAAAAKMSLIAVEEPGEALQAFGRNGFQGLQEMLRIEPVETAGQMVAAASQVERGAHGGDAGD